MINDMYKDTMKGLEAVINRKDQMIIEHTKTIAQLTEGSADELTDIKHMFFVK